MREAKPFASLSSSLLARKGSAKPAMRPQGFGQGMGLEDLGWNDMGQYHPAPPVYDREERQGPSSITALTPPPRAAVPPVEPAPTPPPVIEQQRAIEATFADPVAEPAAAPVKPVVSLPPRQRRAPGSKAKAAFTLRLDAERHLKLRLACAIKHRSAQQIVTEALDALLNSLPEIDAMAKVPGQAGKAN